MQTQTKYQSKISGAITLGVFLRMLSEVMTIYLTFFAMATDCQYPPMEGARHSTDTELYMPNLLS